MPLRQKLTRLTKSFPISGILTETNKTGNKLKGNSRKSMKLMRLFPTKTKEQTMTMWLMDNSLTKMPIELSKDSSSSMEWLMRMRNNSLTLTTPNERKTTMTFWVSLEPPQLMILSQLIENWLCNTILKTIPLQMLERNSMKLMKLTTPFQTRLAKTTTIVGSSARLPHWELTTSSKISGAIDGMNLKMIVSSDLFSLTNGLEILIDSWVSQIGTIMIGAMLKKENLNEVKLTTLIRMELSTKKLSIQGPKLKMECQSPRQLNNTTSPMEPEKCAR